MGVGFCCMVRRRFCVTDLNEFPTTSSGLAKMPISTQNIDKSVRDK